LPITPLFPKNSRLFYCLAPIPILVPLCVPFFLDFCHLFPSTLPRRKSKRTPSARRPKRPTTPRRLFAHTRLLDGGPRSRSRSFDAETSQENRKKRQRAYKPKHWWQSVWCLPRRDGAAEGVPPAPVPPTRCRPVPVHELDSRDTNVSRTKPLETIPVESQGIKISQACKKKRRIVLYQQLRRIRRPTTPRVAGPSRNVGCRGETTCPQTPPKQLLVFEAPGNDATASRSKNAHDMPYLPPDGKEAVQAPNGRPRRCRTARRGLPAARNP